MLNSYETEIQNLNINRNVNYILTVKLKRKIYKVAKNIVQEDNQCDLLL